MWSRLLKVLPDLEPDWSPEASRFHEFWHLVLNVPSQESTRANFYLFHGHIFALHPAGGELASTPTGQQVIGAWLAAEAPAGTAHLPLDRFHRIPGFERLLGVMDLAVWAYAERHNVQNELRRQCPESLDPAHLDAYWRNSCAETSDADEQEPFDPDDEIE